MLRQFAVFSTYPWNLNWPRPSLRLAWPQAGLRDLMRQVKSIALTAKVGQRIRLFILNAGPSQFSAFHVIGALFSDVYIDGNPANHMVCNQTMTIPPGGGVVVEMVIPAAGLYPFVTHSFADASKGALGVLKVVP